MNNKRVLIISNDKLFVKNDTVSSDYNDTVNIIQGLSVKIGISLFSRYSKKKKNFFIRNSKKNFLRFSFFDLFNIKNHKIFMISITPFNFIYFFLIKIFNQNIRGYVLLRSNGYKEYYHKYGIIGYIFYGFMFNCITFFLEVISVSDKFPGIKKNCHLIKPSEIESVWFKKRIRPKLDVPRLFYLGRFKKEKGVFSLINIVNLIDIKFNLKIIGASKKSKIKLPNIKIYKEINSVEKIIKFYDMCNIFILPSYTEGAPKVILESLARYRPVIIFEEIRHVGNKLYGVFVCKRNSNDFKKKIVYIMKNYLKIVRQIKKNKIYTKKNFQSSLRKIIL